MLALSIITYGVIYMNWNNQRGMVSTVTILLVIFGVSAASTVTHFAGQAIYDNWLSAKEKTDDKNWDCLESAKDHKIYCFKKVEK
jgi:multisubunit Na+/H+ antiporter MnhG subunit